MRKMLVAVPCQLVQCGVTEARPGGGGTSGGMDAHVLVKAAEKVLLIA